jgi:hypothetical protein
MCMDDPLPLRIAGDAAEQRDDLSLLIELNPLLKIGAVGRAPDLRPSEQGLVDGPDGAEVAISDVVLLSELGETREDVITSLVRFTR